MAQGVASPKWISSVCLEYLMVCMSFHTDIGPVSITTDPEKFQQDLQELFVQVGTRMPSWMCSHLVLKTVCDRSHPVSSASVPLLAYDMNPNDHYFCLSSLPSKALID